VAVILPQVQMQAAILGALAVRHSVKFVSGSAVTYAAGGGGGGYLTSGGAGGSSGIGGAGGSNGSQAGGNATASRAVQVAAVQVRQLRRC
jgi:hypothetical protein